MPRYNKYDQDDEAPKLDGDGGFIGMDASRDPRLIGPGFCSMAKNKIFDRGVAETRKGFATVGWAQDWGLQFPFSFLLKAAVDETHGGTGGEDTASVSSHRVSDRGIYEFEYYNITLPNGHVHWSVGDVVTTAGNVRPVMNRTAVITYAGDTVIRVSVTYDEWVASVGGTDPNSEALWEGSVSFDKPTGVGAIYGSGVFSDPAGQEGVLIAMVNRAVLLRSGQIPLSIPYPAEETLTEPIEFVQCFDRVVMLRGTEQEPMAWIPQQDFADGIGTFELITQITANPSNPTFIEPIPNGDHGVEFNGRLFVQYSRDQIAISDTYDYTNFDPVFNAFRINEGSDDSITRMLPFGQQRMLVLFDQSIWMLNNVYGDLTAVRGDILTKQRGAIAKNAVLQMGPDVWFLSEGGVYALSQTDEAQLHSGAEPISAAIQPLMDRVNWAAASVAQATSHNGLFYLAVPLDGATYNNALFVYDQVKTAWWGYWQSDMLDIARLVRTDHGGIRQVLIVSGANLDDTNLHGAIYVIGEGFLDETFTDHLDIDDQLLTRGYSFDGETRSKHRELDLHLSAWHPSFDVSHLVDGVGESRSVTGGPVTRDRTKYSVFAKSAYVLTNANDDHADPYREDYSVIMDSVDKMWVEMIIPSDYSSEPYISIRMFEGFAMSDLITVTAGDAFTVQAFLASELNQQWVVDRVDISGTTGYIDLTADEHAVLTAAVAAFYTLSAGYYVMPHRAGSETGIRSYSVETAFATPLDLGSNGVNPQLHQHVERRIRLRDAGAWAQFEITNTQGRCSVHSLMIVGNSGARAYKESR